VPVLRHGQEPVERDTWPEGTVLPPQEALFPQQVRVQGGATRFRKGMHQLLALRTVWQEYNAPREIRHRDREGSCSSACGMLPAAQRSAEETDWREVVLQLMGKPRCPGGVGRLPSCGPQALCAWAVTVQLEGEAAALLSCGALC
jgi:hypothetical protein